MAPTAAGGNFRLGDWLVQPSLCRLTRDGRTVQVRAKVMDLLAYLASRQGQVVSKDDLLNDVWGSLAVSESALTRTVTELRHALEDEADHPRLLETIAKRGYRLIAPVEFIDAPSQSPGMMPWAGEAAAQGTPAISRLRLAGSRSVVAAVAALVGIGLVAASVTLGPGGHTGRTDDIGSTALPLTSDPGFEIDPHLSPDGSQVVFARSPHRDVWDFDLAVKLVGEGPALTLTSDPHTSDLSPAWSPDGRRVAFLRRRTGAPDQLMVIAALGGAARRVATVTTDASLIGDGLLAWMPDSRRVVVAGHLDGRDGLWMVGVDDEARRLIVATPAGHADRGPVVSRNGRYVAFIRKTPASHAALYLVTVNAAGDAQGSATLLHDPAPREAMGLAWGPAEATLVVAVGKHPGPSRLERLRLATDRRTLDGPPEVMPVGTMAYGVDIASSGRLVYAAVQKDTRFWRLDVRQPGRGVEDFGLFDSTLDEAWPHVSPDGARLAFVSTRSGAEEIWVGDLDGRGLRQVTRCGGARCSQPRWSPDGRWLAFTSEVGGMAAIDLVEVDTAVVRRVRDGETKAQSPRWSRDGSWVYFAAYEGARWEIWRVRPTGAGAAQVTRTGGLVAEETPDGRQLVVSRVRDRRVELWCLDLQTGVERRLASTLATAHDFAVGRDGVFYLAGASHGPRTPDERREATHAAMADTAVMRVDIRSGARHLVAPFTRGRWHGFALSPDESTLLGSFTTATGGMDLMLVEPERATVSP